MALEKNLMYRFVHIACTTKTLHYLIIDILGIWVNILLVLLEITEHIT